MSTPMRIKSGFTQDAPYQPLAGIGTPNPFFYIQYDDDFLHYNAGDYTVTAASGSVAATSTKGSGGRLLFTTGATAGNFAEIQLTTTGFAYTPGKRMAYFTRIQAAAASTSSIIAGLIGTNTTPFTSVANGIYFYKAAASTAIQLLVVSSSSTIGSIASVATLAADTDVDLGFFIDRSGNIKVFSGTNLVGASNQNTATLGPSYGLLSSNLSAAIPTNALTPTLALSNGATASATTMASDFQYAAQER